MTPAISAFTIDQAAKLTGLSEAQLRRWDTSGLYVPTHALENRRRPFSRIYAFRDIVGLRALAHIRNTGVTVRKLKDVQEFFRGLSDAEIWSVRWFMFDRKSGRCYFVHEGVHVAVSPIGQVVMPLLVELDPIVRDVQERVERLGDREPGEIGQITRDRYIHSGAWIVAGTRIPVATILAFAENGCCPEEIAAKYPRLHVADVVAALAFAESHEVKMAG